MCRFTDIQAAHGTCYSFSGTECKIANVVIPFFFLCHSPPSHSFLGCCRNMDSYCLKLKNVTPFMPNVKYKFLDSVQDLFWGYHHYFFKIIRFLISSLFNSSKADSDSRWTPWLLAGLRALSAQSFCSQTPWQLHAALGADLEGWVEEHLLQQVSYGASWRGKAAAGTIRAQLHELHAASARSTVAVLEPAEPRWRRSIVRLSRGKCFYCYTIPCASAYLS